MKQKTVKLLSLLMAIIMLSSILLTSCKPQNGDTASSSADSTSVQPASTKIEFIKGGTTEFKIIRPETQNRIVIDAAVLLRKEVAKFLNDDLTGIRLSDDFIKRDETIPEQENVVLVGYTNREESALAYEGLDITEYRVAIINNKIVVAGYTDDALTTAVKLLAKHIYDNITEDKSFTFEEGFLIEGKIEGTPLSDIPMVDSSTVTAVHDMGDSCDLIVTDNGSEAKFEAYKEKLKANGFEEYTTNKLEGNLFATYKNSEYLVSAYYTPASEEIRINVEPLSETTLAPREQDNKYTAVTTPIVTQIGVERRGNGTSYQNGMSYVFRLSDGSFIIYDGGFTNSNTDAKKLNDVLVEQAPDPNNIKIAAWVITHAHSDHYGGFITFANVYNPNAAGSKYTIEMIIRNTPTEKDSSGADNTTTSRQVAVEKMLKDRGVKLVKTHPGQEFYIRDAKITVLYNLEMFVPSSFTYFNTSTTVTKLELAGQSFMMLGDCSEDGSRLMSKHYTKETLMCDFVQVAHHGYTGGTTTLYKLIDPYYVLWPMATTHYAEYKGNPRSSYLISSPKVVDIYNAGYSKFVFELPFNGKNFTKTNYPS